MNSLSVGLVQHRCTADREENLGRGAAGIRRAAEGGAQLAVLPELHGTPYFCQSEFVEHFDLAEPVPGPTTEWLGGLARQLRIAIVGSVFERRAPGIYHNTAVVIDRDGSLAGRYRKMHIPDDPSYYEKFYFTPGDLGFQPVQTSVGKLGVLVCWDQWYPEAARLMALAGAEMLIYPTAIGWDSEEKSGDERRRQLAAWLTIQQGHAVANGLPVVGVNRVGFESAQGGGDEGPGQIFWGNSFVAGPQGEILGMASNDREETLIVPVDGARTEAVRRIWPFFRDRRIDAYQDLLKRFID
ncbi:MAG: carbon-nitrogen hydrolase [Syntrophobacteraceae bacterium]|nr:carbon-nitrogen hydrolase [Desulfobacteraceae bacterium]